MTVINTNVNSLVAQNSISSNSRNLATSMERLSTGSRINSAKDDAAGMAISTRMDSQARGLSMAVRNANDGISLMQTSEGALNEVTEILQRMRELAVQAGNGTNNDTDRGALNDEVVQLKAEIERIATTTEFNNQKLLDGSFTNKSLQIGDKAGQTLAIDMGSARLQDLGLGGTSGSSNALVSQRVALAAFAAGDIQINDQDLGAVLATDDLEDIITNINNNVDNVTASGFNTVVAKSVGTGVTTVGEFQLTVTPLGAASATNFGISASADMAELVANINNEAGTLVQASLTDDGKLVLSNSTGATITIEDNSAVTGTESGSGFSTTATAYAGFLKLESDDGNPVRIDKGSAGTTADLLSLGFMSTTSDVGAAADAYTVTGKALTDTTTAWGASDVKINNVSIYKDTLATTSFEGKLNAINNFSSETGVIASAFAELSVDINDATFDAMLVGTSGDLSINGSTVTLASTMTQATFVTAVNALTSATGLTAVADGDTVKITGSNVVSIVISGASATAGTNFTSGTTYAAIRLDSIDNSPISIELGDASTIAEHGLLEANVGAADFQVNAATMGVASGTSLTGLNIGTASAAASALTTIDSAISTVSDMRSKMGALQNRLNSTVDNLSNVVANTQASRSRIQDTDYAVETTSLAKAQIIQQAATAMLAQANQQPQSVLSLLQ
mgnify:CR=1 FL=1